MTSTINLNDYPYLTKEICEEQIKGNDEVIQKLIDAGDNPNIEREIEHFIYFETIVNRDAFCNEISNLRYRYENAEENIEVKIGKISSISKEKIDADVLEICNISVKHKGNYDGWGCLVQK